MKLESIRIRNFRSFKDELIPFNDYTCLVGPNGAGKSTVLHALNLFFRETADIPTDLINLDEQDFHNGNVNDPIEITVTFSALSDKAKDELKAYFRQGRVVITAVAHWDADTRVATISQKGERLVMKPFATFFEAEKSGKLVADLKQIYEPLRQQFSDLPGPASKWTKGAMTDALRAYEEQHADLCTLERSDDHFYGFTKGENKLAPFVQWVYVPAVKDATKEQIESRNTALGRLLQRTVRGKIDYGERLARLRDKTQAEYARILEDNKADLESLSNALNARLKILAHPDASVSLEWWQEIGRSVQIQDPVARVLAGEHGFLGDLGRLGHGLQRSYLLALLQELAGCDDPSGPRLLLGCEEPELYQHPPQARHLSEVLRQLSSKGAQIIISTHSPLFIQGERVEEIRAVRWNTKERRSAISLARATEIEEKIAKAKGQPPRKPEGLLAKIHQTLQPAFNEMFFSPHLVLVEGLEDRAYITTWFHLSNMWDDYRRAHIHIVPVDGKRRLIEAIAIADSLGIPTFVVFDADGQENKEDKRALHKADNAAILALAGVDGVEPFPATTFWGERLVTWPTEMGDIVEQEVGSAVWTRLRAQADVFHGQPGNLHKNELHIATSLKCAHDEGIRPPSLQKLCDAVLKFSRVS